jgi:hypothetical protein
MSKDVYFSWLLSHQVFFFGFIQLENFIAAKFFLFCLAEEKSVRHIDAWLPAQQFLPHHSTLRFCSQESTTAFSSQVLTGSQTKKYRSETYLANTIRGQNPTTARKICQAKF